MTSRTRLLLPAAFITSLGNNIQLLGAALLLVRAHGSMLDVGWLFIAVAVPQAALSPYFGRLADRFDRRRLWVGCDAVSAVAALALPIGLALGGPQQPLVYLTNFVLAVIAALFTPASAALIRERVPTDQLRPFNAHYEIALQSGMLLSAAAGGLALQHFGPQPLFTFNACTFALSAVFVAAVGKTGTKKLPEASTPERRLVSGLPLVPLAVLFGQGLVVVTVFNALMPVLVVGEWGRSAGVLGVTDALGGVGFLLAAAVYRRSAQWFGDLRLAVGGFMICSALLALQPLFGVPVLMGLVLLGAFLFGQSRIATRSLLMTSVDESRVGHAFGIANGYGLAATVVVMLIASIVTGHTDTRFGFATLAVISLLSAVAAATAIVHRNRAREPKITALI
ncbi:MFS transporter [Kribbella jejuensis]|uniref:MFS transporter n=1 Tax=Kribbella jejuensis TaxID=236068 RepID=A0A542E9Q7_9ACTN|nr:MFS transporter [Kribbella jejuensis]TQJ12067.1 MFS transporter [Kribbella jejuensis]